MTNRDVSALFLLALGLAGPASACLDPERGGEIPSSAGDDGGGTWGGLPGDGDGIDDGVDDGAADGDGGGAGLDVGGGAGPRPEDDPMPPPEERPVCDEENPVTLYLSPDDSNSMSSPVQAREAVLTDWNDPSAVPVRTWEFFNYYDFDYPPAPAGQLALTVELHRPDDSVPGDFLLQIGVSSEAVAPEDRPPMNLTLVLDASGSMEGHSMQMLEESCRAIAASLRDGDVVSMVTWDTANAIILAGYTVAGPNDPLLLSKIDEVEAGGGTDLHGGLTAGYELAQQVYDPERINRVVLISDGGANAGITDIEIIATGAGEENAEGIYLVGAGVGTASSYHDTLMDQVTDAGKGASVFIPDAEEAWKVFHQQFDNTMQVAARDVRVRVDLPAGFRFITFSGEEMSADPEEVEPQHVGPNDAVVFHQHISSCAPQLLGPDSTFTVTATYKDAITFAEHEISQTHTFDDLLQIESPRLLEGAAVFAYATALQAYKTAPDAAARSEAIAQGLAAVDLAQAALPADPDLAEIREVLEALP